MRKVFVTQYSKGLNFSEAGAYGEVVFLTGEEFRPEPTMPQINDSVVAEIKNKMKDYIPGKDSIVTTGSAIPNVVVGSVLAKIKGEHRILKWSNRSKTYELYLVRI